MELSRQGQPVSTFWAKAHVIEAIVEAKEDANTIGEDNVQVARLEAVAGPHHPRHDHRRIRKHGQSPHVAVPPNLGHHFEQRVAEHYETTNAWDAKLNGPGHNQMLEEPRRIGFWSNGGHFKKALVGQTLGTVREVRLSKDFQVADW